jgi:non-homologous end joining protein Ku
MVRVIARGVLSFGLVSIPLDIPFGDRRSRYRSMNNALVMHFLYFANEVRDFDEIPKAEGEKVPKRETILPAI